MGPDGLSFYALPHDASGRPLGNLSARGFDVAVIRISPEALLAREGTGGETVLAPTTRLWRMREQPPSPTRRTLLPGRSIAVRLFLYVVIVGTALTVVVAAINVIQDYRARSEQLQTMLDGIGESYAPAIAQSLFEFNTDQLQLLLDGIVLLSDVAYARVIEPVPDGSRLVASSGTVPERTVIEREYPLQVRFQGELRELGAMQVQASDPQIRDLVRDRLGVLILSTGLQVFAVAIVLWAILEHAVVRHLRHIAGYVRSVDVPSETSPTLELHRSTRSDELREITVAINDAYAHLVRSHESLSEALQQKNTLLQELYHRTKNNMQTIAAILDMRAARAPEDAAITDLVRETRSRINAMSLVHEKLYQSRDLSRIPMDEYLSDLVASISHSYADYEDVTLDLQADDARITLDTAIPLGLAVTELVSNSMKHAFPDGRQGRIQIRFQVAPEGTLRLRYHDDGVGLPPGTDPSRAEGVGLRTVVSLVEGQLNGSIQFNSDTGFGCTIILTGERYTERV